MAIRKVIKNHTELVDDPQLTYLTTATTGGSSTTLVVQSIKEFAINQTLLIGEFGDEKSEIVKTHASTAPISSTITLTGALTFDHPIDTPIYWIDYDQIEFSHDATATATSPSAKVTENIEADSVQTIYKEDTETTGYFYTRYKNSISTTYSGYSDAEPYANFDEDTVYAIKERAMNELGETYGGWLTSDWMNERLWQARRLVHNKIKRWSWRQAFDTDLGNLSTGDYRIAMPTDIKDANTNKDVMSIKIGANEKMEYITKSEMDEEWLSSPRTTLSVAYTVADASITLTDSRDFDDSGSIVIDEDTIEYSANSRSTGVLTVSTDGTYNHSVDDNVYQNVSFTLPTKYTIFEGYIEFNYPLDSDYDGYNCWIDYYKMLTEYDSEGDELDEPEFDFYVNYLKFQIKHRQSQGTLGVNDVDYQLFLNGLGDLIRKEISGQEIRFIPDIEHLEQD